LALGPMAILCLMFKPTSKFFDSWLSLVLSAVVLAWFVFFALGFSFFVVKQLLDGVQSSGAFTAGGAAAAIEAAATYLTFMIMLSVLLYQAPHLASQLTGGASIQTGAQVAAAGLAAKRLFGGGGSGGAGAAGATGSGGSVSRGAGIAYGAGRATGAVAGAGASAAGAVADVGAAGGRAAMNGGRWAYQRVAALGNRKK